MSDGVNWRGTQLVESENDGKCYFTPLASFDSTETDIQKQIRQKASNNKKKSKNNLNQPKHWKIFENISDKTK